MTSEVTAGIGGGAAPPPAAAPNSEVGVYKSPLAFAFHYSPWADSQDLLLRQRTVRMAGIIIVRTLT